MNEGIQEAGNLETPEDAGSGEAGEVARWLKEIDLAGKVEADWRKKAKRAIDRYRDEKDRADSQFNIFWANVETERPQLYNTTPKADVRRRFPDADPVGKTAAEVMERALNYSIESYDFDEEIDNIINDYQIPSRGLGRVRFEPTVQSGEDGQPQSLTYARCYIEHVPWDRFRRGPGLTWREIPWIAYEHQLTRAEIDLKFPEFGAKVQFDIVMEGVDEKEAATSPDVFKRVRVWEILDKQTKKTRFLAPSCKERFLLVEDDKLNLQGFFDCDRPLYAVKTATTLVPKVKFDMYRDQAKELDRVTTRIDRIMRTLKQRGIYDSTIAELKDLMKASDNEMIPTSNAAPAMQAGGLDKAVWMMPIEQAAKVLQSLILHREQLKQTIYELTGLSDVLRGASDPHETLGAQQLKAQTGNLRIQRSQREIQRLIRGLLRKKAEIIAENYTPELLSLMTGIQLIPTVAEKQAAKQQYEMQASQPQQQQGAPPPSPLLGKPTWEEVMQVLKSDLLRSFRIDIETDSTIAADEASERQQVTEMITGIGGFVQNIGPAVESGAISMESAKAILVSALRRFKMGRSVEDALEQEELQPKAPPQEKPDPAMAKVQGELQMQQKEMEGRLSMEQQRAQMDADAQRSRLALEAEAHAAKRQADAQSAATTHELERERMQGELAIRREEMMLTMQLKHQEMEARLEMQREQAKRDSELAYGRTAAEMEIKRDAVKQKGES